MAQVSQQAENAGNVRNKCLQHIELIHILPRHLVGILLNALADLPELLTPVVDRIAKLII